MKTDDLIYAGIMAMLYILFVVVSSSLVPTSLQAICASLQMAFPGAFCFSSVMMLFLFLI